MNKDGDLKQTLKEVKHLLLAWLFFSSWVLIYCGFEAYSQDHEDVKITLGMPSWVFWGIAVPWICSIVFTIYFSLFVMKDNDHEEK